MSTGAATNTAKKKASSSGSISLLDNSGKVKTAMVADPGDGSPVPNIPDVVDIPADQPFVPPTSWLGDTTNPNATETPNTLLPDKNDENYEAALAAYEAQKKESEKRKTQKGYNSTLLTTPFGLLGQASTKQRKTLLGL